MAPQLWSTRRIQPLLTVSLVSFLAALIAIFAFGNSVDAASNCSVSASPTGGTFTVTLCITSPANGVTVSGPVPVQVSTSVTGPSVRIQKIIYYLDNQYLLTNYTRPFSFILPSNYFVDGNHLLQARTVISGTFYSNFAGINVTTSNGVSSAPRPSGSFTPAKGTLPAAGSPYVVAAVGDGASGELNSSQVVNRIKSWNPNLMLYLGDVYDHGTMTEFYNWYGPSNFFGVFRSITNPTVGNHEYLTPNALGYFYYWNNIPSYYSYDANGWHLVSLNSNSRFASTSVGSPQYNWLAQDLAANAGKCTIVYYHHPLFNVGPEGSTTQMSAIWSLLAQNHVDIVLNGHDHDYQRWTALDAAGNPSPTGITEFVVGGGGHSIQHFVKTDSRLVFGSNTAPTTYGALDLQLGASAANFQYINAGGTVLDSGSVTCK